MKRSVCSRLLSLSLTLAMAVSLTAPARADEEGEGTQEPEEPTTGSTLSVELSPSTLELALGEKAGLEAVYTLEPEADASEVSWDWTSDNPQSAGVSGTGEEAIVTASSVGEATITVEVSVKVGGQTLTERATCKVTVDYTPAESVTLSVGEMVLDPRESRDLTASVSPPSANTDDISWTSSGEAVAQLSSKRGQKVTVTGGEPGKSTVTAIAGNSASAPATCEVTVRGLVMEQKSITLATGTSKQLTVTPYEVDGAVKEWTSGNESVAIVTSDGQVTGQSEGSTTITVTMGSYSATCEVEVRETTANTITGDIDAGRPFPLTDVRSDIDDNCRDVLGSGLYYVTNLSVPTEQGILYYGYVSPDDTGYGVGSTERYYYSDSVTGERSLSGVTFVPNPAYTGTVTITYSGYNSSNQSFTGAIKLEVEGSSDVSYTGAPGSPVTFRASDFSAVCRERNGRELDYVVFELPSSGKGTLYYNYIGSGQYGEAVTSGGQYFRTRSPYLDNVTFLPAKEAGGSVRINYRGVDTSGDSFSGRVTVYLTGGSGSSSGSGRGDINYRTDRGEAVDFRTSDFNDLCRDETGEYLDYVRFDLPSSSDGTLYYHYTGSGDYDDRVSSSDRFYRSDRPYLSDVSFVPRNSFRGTVDIDFTGYSVDGDRFTGTVSIEVDGGGDYGDIVYTTGEGEAVDFRASDFNDLCRDENGASLDYVRFTLPSSSRGTLYYDYRSSNLYGGRVSSSTRYYRNGSPSLSDVTFVPKSGYNGTVDIDFTGYDVDGDRVTGTVRIEVGRGGGSGEVVYTTGRNDPVDFRAVDFNDACRDETGANLDYVRFTLPSSSRGTLYYDYRSGTGYGRKVTENTRYYRSGSPSLSDVTFVPKSGYSGTVTIDFTGYDVNGDRYEGSVVVKVQGGGSSGEADITYTTGKDERVVLRASDFNDACREATGRNLDYVRFDQPYDREGTLYYDYRSAGNKGSRVSSSTNYYRSGSSRTIGEVSFVPREGYTGEAEFDFTGYDVDGERFTGTVRVTVGTGGGGQSQEADQVLRYSLNGGGALAFNAGDFNTACRAATGSALSHVTFTLPAQSFGTLYYQYDLTSGRYGSLVDTTTNYYRSGGNRLLSNVSFVATGGYSGTVEIPFTGWSTDNDRFTGRIVIQVSTPTSGAIRYQCAPGQSVTFRAADFHSACSSAMGRELSYVQFTSLPPASAGELYLGYTGAGQYTGRVNTQTRYEYQSTAGIGQVTFVPASGYQGTVSIPYVGVDTGGSRFSGTVEITVASSAGSSGHFTDMAGYAWASQAVDYLYQRGVVSGVSNTEFGPGQPILRGDFVLMLCRAFDLNTGNTESFSDVPSGSYYAWAVATAKDLDIAQGSDGLFMPNRPLTRQDAMVLLQRAMRASGWSISDGGEAALRPYADSGEIASYARGAVSALLQAGIVQGNGAGRLNPTQTMTRGEMAVILYRVLTA